MSAGGESVPRRTAWRRLLDRVTAGGEPDLRRTGLIPSIAPPLAKATDAIRESLLPLRHRGALDEGTGSVMDPAIASWVEQWHNEIDDEFDAQQSDLELIKAEAEAELERCQSLLDLARAELVAADHELVVLNQPTVPGSNRGRAKRRRFRQRRDHDDAERRPPEERPDLSGGGPAPAAGESG